MEIEITVIRSPSLLTPAGMDKKVISYAKIISFDILLPSLIPL